MLNVAYHLIGCGIKEAVFPDAVDCDVGAEVHGSHDGRYARAGRAEGAVLVGVRVPCT